MSTVDIYKHKASKLYVIYLNIIYNRTLCKCFNGQTNDNWIWKKSMPTYNMLSPYNKASTSYIMTFLQTYRLVVYHCTVFMGRLIACGHLACICATDNVFYVVNILSSVFMVCVPVCGSRICFPPYQHWWMNAALRDFTLIGFSTHTIWKRQVAKNLAFCLTWLMTTSGSG